MTALPVDHVRLSKDILELVRQTNLNLLTSKFVRTQMEKKHGVCLDNFRKEIDGIIRDSIKQIESDKSNVKSMNGTTFNALAETTKLKESSLAKLEPQILLADYDGDNDIYSAVKRRRAAQRTTAQRKPPAKRARKSKEGGAKKNTAFTRICVLSDELSAVLKRKYMRRSDVVKSMWYYFRFHNLLDPKDRRYVLVDDLMRPVFGTKRIQAFGMMKILKHHIKDIDYLDEDTRRTAIHEIEQLEENGELDLGLSVSAGTSKSSINADLDPDSDSSSESEEEIEHKPVAISSASSKPTNNHLVNESPSTSKIEEPRAAKLVLRISKKNDRVVSVKVKDDDDPHQIQNSTIDNGVNQNLSSNASTADLDGPPQLDLEVPNEGVSSSLSSDSSDSSNSSSGSSLSSSAASTPNRNGATNIHNSHLSNDLQLSESDSDV